MLNLFYSNNKICDNIKIKNKNLKLTSDFVGLTLFLYNGKKYIPLFIKSNMVNHYVGEYLFTKKLYLKKKKKIMGHVVNPINFRLTKTKFPFNT
jgi:ribosomal protein S19